MRGTDNNAINLLNFCGSPESCPTIPNQPTNHHQYHTLHCMQMTRQHGDKLVMRMSNGLEHVPYKRLPSYNCASTVNYVCAVADHGGCGS